MNKATDNRFEEKVITNVYTFPNGQCMVFDQHGQQMPEYQGRTEDMMEKIHSVYNGPIMYGSYR